MALQHVLATWCPCLPDVRNTIAMCMIKPMPHISTRTFRVEAAGSGIFVGMSTNPFGQWPAYRIFLGHGGPEITSIDQIPLTFHKCLTICKRAFQGIPHNFFNQKKSSKVMGCKCEWNTPSTCEWNSPGTLMASSVFKDQKIVLTDIRGNVVREINHAAEKIRTFEWSPHGDMILGILQNTSIQVWDIHGNNMVADSNWMHHVDSCRWNPDNKTIAVCAGVVIYIVTFNWYKSTSPIQQTVIELNKYSIDCAWNHSGAYIAVHDDEHVHVISKASCQTVAKLDLHGTFEVRPAFDMFDSSVYWSPTDKKMVVITSDDVLSVWDSTTWQNIKRERVLTIMFSIAWSPDEKYIALSHNAGVEIRDSNLCLIQTLVPTIQGRDCLTFECVWHPYNNSIAAVASDEDTQHIYVWLIQTQNATHLKTITNAHSDDVFKLFWHPSGKYLFSHDVQEICKVWK